MDAATAKNFKLDASAGGCSGMFWRTKPEMSASTSGSDDWPRNGTLLKGWYVEEHPGWVKIDHPSGYWMPVEQHGKAVMHEVAP
ncbi:unnamed protein product [Scytosiphon promiscuus]